MSSSSSTTTAAILASGLAVAYFYAKQNKESEGKAKTGPITLKDAKASGRNNLLQSEAESRSKQVSNVAYTLTLSFVKGSDEYEGTCTITFEKSAEACLGDLFLDFVGKEILELVANGEKVCKEGVFEENRVQIKDLVKPGKNTITIKYLNDFDHTGAGIHKFTDPVDQQEYIYTNFEPFECHRLLPCFDQPDIRASIQLTLTAPTKWEVIANGAIEKTSVDGCEDGYSTRFFEDTPSFSTYLFAVVAGPFDHFHDSFDNGRVPMGIYVRKSLAKFIDCDEIFSVSKSGMEFYERFFDIKYPFTKYDQLFVPEFNEGAMENVGCVTFTENYIFRETPTRMQRARRCDTILHEMAHMWFGNLVTPVWWDGLWLNESFATYMAALCTAEATKFGQLSWQNFNSDVKGWAYREDQLSTTHPIQCEVKDTDATFLNFDGITYGKGSSLLKQLVYLVGDAGFRTGLRHYFNKFKWSNTVISDFLEALAVGVDSAGEGVSFNAKEWSQSFLEKAGLNTLTPTLEVADGKITSFSIAQSAPEAHPTLRSHFVEVGVFDMEEGKAVFRTSYKINVLPQEVTEVEVLKGEPAPAMTFINMNDHGYIKVLCDPISMEFAKEHLGKLDSSLLRQQLWAVFYNMTRDALMSADDFLDLVLKHVCTEDSPKLVQTIIRRANAACSAFIPDAMREEYSDSLFKVAFKKLEDSTEAQWQIVWQRAAIGFARSKASVEILAKYLGEGEKIGTFELDQSSRWSVVQKAMAHNIDGAEELLAKESEKDGSDRGLRSALTAKSSKWDEKVKAEAWARYMSKDTKASHHEQSADFAGFRWFHQREMLEKYKQLFFDNIKDVYKDRTKEFSRSFFYNLFPHCPEDPEVFEKTEALLASLDEKDAILRRIVKEQLDDLNRAKKCRALIFAKL